jgi:hypothetical protein
VEKIKRIPPNPSICLTGERFLNAEALCETAVSVMPSVTCCYCCLGRANAMYAPIGDLQNFQDANDLFFLAGMGAMKQPVEDNPYYGEFNPFWERLAAAVAEIGDDPLTFKLLGDAYQPFDADERTTICLSARSYRMPHRCLRTLPGHALSVHCRWRGT